MKKLLLGGAAAAAMFAGAALAQTAPSPPPSGPMMRMHDKTITRDEVTQHVREMFARLDTNHDGYLTRDEVQADHEKMMGEMHARMEQRRAASFDQLDTNHDGSLSRQEYMARPPMQGAHWASGNRGGPEGPGDRHGPGGMRSMHRASMGMFGHMFDRADSNKDGKVSLAEMQAAALQHFDRADLNHDGSLTPDERRQVHQLMRGKPQPQ